MDASIGGDGGSDATASANDGAGGGDGGDASADTGVESGSGCGTLTLCGSTCVDTMTDKFNCGSCGSTCVVHCVAGQCSDPVAISAGYQHSCALLSGGTVACWGLNGNGQLGSGSTSDAWAPVAVSGLTGVTAVSAGFQHSCAVLSNGAAVCWGRNDGGQLGNGTTAGSPTPVSVAGLSGATAIAAGEGGADGHSCALLSGGTVQCWGANNAGQLGNGTMTAPDAGTLVTVSGLSGATAIGAGHSYSCALLSDGSVKCWGALPRGSNTATPVVVPGLNGGASRVACGSDYACALLSDGTAKCWGVDGSGQLGNNQIASSIFAGSTTAVAVSGLSGVAAIAAGNNDGTIDDGYAGYSCALLSVGTGQCWGANNFGQLGNGSTTTPDGGATVLVSGLSSAMAVTAGNGYSCALLSDRSVECWGNNGNGELGNGTTTNSPTPVQVAF